MNIQNSLELQGEMYFERSMLLGSICDNWECGCWKGNKRNDPGSLNSQV